MPYRVLREETEKKARQEWRQQSHEKINKFTSGGGVTGAGGSVGDSQVAAEVDTRPPSVRPGF